MTSKNDVAVKVHMAAVVPAVAVGAFIMATKKGTRQHVLAGRFWTAAMFTAGVSSIGIRNIMADGSMSPVHALGAATLLSVGKGIHAIRQRNIKVHKKFMLISLIGMVATGIAANFPRKQAIA